MTLKIVVETTVAAPFFSGVKPGQPGPVGEYLELRDWWKVVPWLETRLAPLLEKHLSRYA